MTTQDITTELTNIMTAVQDKYPDYKITGGLHYGISFNYPTWWLRLEKDAEVICGCCGVKKPAVDISSYSNKTFEEALAEIESKVAV